MKFFSRWIFVSPLAHLISLNHCNRKRYRIEGGFEVARFLLERAHVPATNVSSRPDSTQPRRADRALIWILAAGAVLRLVILVGTADLPLHIVDEQHYAALAGNLTHSGVFAVTPGRPTSIRPPLYPAFIAGLWRLTGQESLQLVRAAQIALSLASVVLLYRIGTQLLDRRATLLATAGLCFYPSLLIGNYLLLTETLFTFLLLVFIHGYIALLRRPRPLVALQTGGALALAALTRSILWPFPVLLAPLTYLSLTGHPHGPADDGWIPADRLRCPSSRRGRSVTPDCRRCRRSSTRWAA